MMMKMNIFFIIWETNLINIPLRTIRICRNFQSTIQKSIVSEKNV